MDHEVAEWLADLIQQTVISLEHRPGLTIEVDDDPSNWVQVIPTGNANGQLAGFVLNLPFRASGDPLEHLTQAGIQLPPGTDISSVEAGSHVTLSILPNIPLVALAMLIGDLLSSVGKATDGYEINVQVMHGL